MKYIRSEQGNTLIIVLLMVVIFTVTGLSLISTTFNGVKKTDAREAQIKSVELAEKGIDYIITLIESKSLEYERLNLSVDQFKLELGNLLKPYEVKTASDPFGQYSFVKTTNKDNEKIRVKIYERDYITTNNNDVSQIMKIDSEAVVGGKTKTISTTIRLNAKPVPDALKYALGTYNPTPSIKDDNAGNMYLHGGVSVKGDVYVEKNLYTYDRAYAILWFRTDYPSIEGFNGKKSNLVVKGSLYTLLKNPPYFDHINNRIDKISETYRTIQKTNISSAFTTFLDANREFVPNLVDSSPKFKPVNIGDEEKNYSFTDTDRKFPNVIKAKDKCLFNIIGKVKIKENGKDKEIFGCTDSYNNVGNLYMNNINTDMTIFKDYTFNRLSYNSSQKDLIIDSENNETTSINFTEGAYINGNLKIGNRGQEEDRRDKIEINGPIYVNGNLEINWAEVKFNSTIYVTGSTSVFGSLIQGKGPANKEGTLVVFGKQPIQFILNNTSNSETMIKGFFYSEDLIEIYGVLSNINIHGGVFGKKVVLNGVKNDSHPDSSRLSIVYDPQITRNPPEGLPIVKALTVTKQSRTFK